MSYRLPGLAGVGALADVAKGCAQSVFEKSVRMGIGAFPTQVAVFDATGMDITHPYIHDLRRVDVRVLSHEYNKARGRFQGAVLTDLVYGLSTPPDGYVTVTVPKFTDDGYVTLFLPAAIACVFIVGNTVLYPAAGVTHHGVRVHTQQLSELVIVVDGVASVAMHYTFVPDERPGRFVGLVADMVRDGVLPEDNVAVHTVGVPVTGRTIDRLHAPQWCHCPAADGAGVTLLRFKSGEIVVGNALHAAREDWRYVAAPSSAIPRLFLSQHTNVQFGVFGDSAAIDWTDAVAPSPVMSARL